MSDNTKKIESKGFCLYKDTLQTAFNILPTYEERGKLFTSILQYVNNEKLDKFDERIETCFLFLQNSIKISNEKYLKRKKTQKEYYDHIKEVREKNKLNQYNNNNEYNNKDNNEYNNKDNNEDINNNISFSFEYIKEALERERFFLKKKALEDFYSLNENTYHWKLDPITAVRTYIEKHPDALTAVGEKKLPPVAPAPPATPDSLKKYKEYFSKIFTDLFGVANCKNWMQKIEIIDLIESKNRFNFFTPSRFFAEYFREKFETQLINEVEKLTKKRISIFYAIHLDGEIAYITPKSLAELV